MSSSLSSSFDKPINLLRGHPNPSLLPTKEMQTLMASLSAPNTTETVSKYLGYGAYKGNKELLVELEAFVKRHTNGDDLGNLVDKQGDENRSHNHYMKFVKTEFFITHGVSHGIDLLCATQTKPGDLVLLENPTYFLVGDIFRSHGLKIQSLPMTCGGTMDVERLIHLVEQGIMVDIPRLIYIIPSYQNPTGYTMPIEDRIKLARFAIRHGIIIVADEVYHLLDWRNSTVDGERPARMAALNHHYASSEKDSNAAATQANQTLKDQDAQQEKRVGGCCTVSSFTKIWSPGVRLGWIEGPPEIVDHLKKHGYIQSQGGCAPFMGEIMRRALSTRMADDVLQKLRNSYQHRVTLVCNILEETNKVQIIRKPLGGYFIWIRFPKGIKSEEFLMFCKEQVTFLPGERCDPFTTLEQQQEPVAEGNNASSSLQFHNDTAIHDDDGGMQSYARLCFADLDLDMLEEGAKRLVRCLHQYTESKALK